MTYIDPRYQLTRYAESLDTPGRRLGLCIADTVVTFYVTAAKAIVEAITSLVTGNYPYRPQVPTRCPGYVIPGAALRIPDNDVNHKQRLLMGEERR